MSDKPEKLLNRDQLRKEIDSLTEEQAAEVLEYVSIMKTMREQEADPLSFKDEIRILLAEPGTGKPETESARRPEGTQTPPTPGSKGSPQAG